MEKKIIVILEILIIGVAFLAYTFKEAIPEYKKSIGSSDKFINTEIYNKMYEFNIDNKINFSIIIDENNNIYHMFFFDKESACLANKNIENNKLEEGLKKIYNGLIEKDYLTNTSNINIIRYDNKENIIYDLVSNLNRFYNIKGSINIVDSTIENKINELKLESVPESYLKDLDLYSKEYIRLTKNVVLSKEESINTREYSDNVYSKITNYMNMNGISNLNTNDTTLVINMIPGDEEYKYYPSINSWYYVKDKKVYAYIEFIINDNNVKGYCYEGSIDLVKEGVC